MANLTVSITLATFNGGRYIATQLQSLARQTCAPVELVIADDGSTDDTVAIIRDFARTTSIPVRIVGTTGGNGPTRNFERAMMEARGDVVMCCDQDDVWHPYKIERMLQAFNPMTTLVFCDANLVDENLIPLGKTLWERLNFEANRFNPIEYLGKRTIAFGLTMAYRNSPALRNLVFPIPMPFGHDNFVALVAACMGEIKIVPMPLLDYRQHSGQVSGTMGKKTPLQVSITPCGSSFDALVTRIGSLATTAEGRALVQYCAKKANHLYMREQLTQTPYLARLIPIAKATVNGDYQKFSNGSRSLFSDLIPGRTL